MTHLLDTNVCIDVLRGKQAIIEKLRKLSPDDCGISSITLFELLSGALKSMNPEQETEKVKGFTSAIHVMPFDEACSEQAATIRSQLESQGIKIGAYDILIAAHAMTLKAICVTDNSKEFSRVEGLNWENWNDSSR